MAKVAGSDRGVIQSRQTKRAAVTDRWYLWTVAVVGSVLAWYFYTHPDIWTMQAEGFYVLIFGCAALLAVVAGAYRIYSRPTYSTPR